MKRRAKIKVAGVGGSGSNTISRMFNNCPEGVELIAFNTDYQDLEKTKAHQKIWIGGHITQGLGTGMDPEMGKKSAEESVEEVEKVMSGADLIFLTCGLGGGTGTGATPVIAEAARRSGALTIAAVTTPFSFEGSLRRQIAQQGLKNLSGKTDSLISISNDKLFSFDVSLASAFSICDEVLEQAVRGLADLIVLPGIVTIDLAGVKSVLHDSGSALFGTGTARGEKRVSEAVMKALNSPLLDISCRNAKGALFSVSGGDDISLNEIQEAARLITKQVSPSAKVIFGAVKDDNLKKGDIKITVILTGFPI
jgi:cell division protein FtsZ